MRYNNRFFETRDDAKAFQKEHGGVFLSMTPRSHSSTKMEFHAEMMVALDARGEHVDPEKTPYCVAWNEREPED